MNNQSNHFSCSLNLLKTLEDFLEVVMDLRDSQAAVVLQTNLWDASAVDEPDPDVSGCKIQF